MSEEVAVAAIVTTTISKRKKEEKIKMQEKNGLNIGIYTARSLGIYDTLLSELHVEEEYDYRTFLRMNILRKYYT